DDRVGDDEVGRARFAARLRRLSHAVADDLAAAELRFVAVGRGVVLDLDDEVGVGKADAVAGRRPVVIGIGAAIDLHRAAFVKASTASSAAARTAGSSSAPSTSWFS